MALDGKAFQDITEEDLSALCANEEYEGKILEFKERLPDNSDDSRKEFLADISSFANASGGIIIFGIQEERGRAIALPGISSDDLDKEILRIENIIRDGVQARIPSYLIRSIPLANGCFAILVSIQQSWIGPHMVTFRNLSRFYGRNTNGKYQLDVQEIRQSFLLSDSINTRIRNFHNERVAKVIAGETPVPLPQGAKIIMHFLPIASFQSNLHLNIKEAGNNFFRLDTLTGQPNNYRYNIDGLVTLRSLSDEQPQSYTQLFRNGTIETVDAYLLMVREGNSLIIPSTMYEQSTMEVTSRLLGFQKQSSITPPIQITVTIVGAKGYKLAINHNLQMRHWLRQESDNAKIDRDILSLPDVIVDSYEEVNLSRLLRPIFDAVWNSTGWPECLDYNQAGEFVSG